MNGHQPEGVDPQFLQIIQLLCDAVEVADTVSVCVIKTADEDFVKDRLAPPGKLRGCRG